KPSRTTAARAGLAQTLVAEFRFARQRVAARSCPTVVATDGEAHMPTTRARRPARVRDASAAGGVVVRGSGDSRGVGVAGREGERTGVFPKGMADRGAIIG